MTADKPVRVQLSRARGWRMPENTVVVSRPSKWGNPFDWRQAPAEYQGKEGAMRWWAAQRYDYAIHHPSVYPRVKVPTVAQIQTELRGKNLACWCADDNCHATVLLIIANGPLE